MMENRETVDEMQPTNADLMRYIIDGRKEVKQLQKNLDELTKMVKQLQKEPPRSPRMSLDTSHANNCRRKPSEKLLMRESTKMFLLRNVDFAEVEMACNGWSDILGVGGFGEVYKGRWNGQDIAVKRLRNDKRPRDVQGCGDDAYQRYIEQTFTELQVLHCYPAENILPLLAFSFNEFLQTDPCLIYLHMANGSVLDRLNQKGGTPPLSWDTRAYIALGTAKGLTHLHANKINHGDIKSGNVLLDKHFEPKIGDFGLARGGTDIESTHITVSMVIGTKHYLPEDFMRNGHLGPEVDTFCYGILLFELYSGKGPSFKVGNTTVRDIMLDPNNDNPTHMVDRNYGDIEKLPDPMQSKWPLCLHRLGKDCTRKHRKNRPPMDKVHSALEFLHKTPLLQERANKEPLESVMQVNFPAPIPTILNDATDSSVGIVFSPNSSYPDTDTSSNVETTDADSKSPTNHSPLTNNPVLHGNMHLYDEALPSMSGHIRKLYSLS